MFLLSSIVCMQKAKELVNQLIEQKEMEVHVDVHNYVCVKILTIVIRNISEPLV